MIDFYRSDSFDRKLHNNGDSREWIEYLLFIENHTNNWLQRDLLRENQHHHR